MTTCYFVSDLHGNVQKYELLFREIIRNKPSFVFLGGDLLPHVHRSERQGNAVIRDFARDFIIPGFKNVRQVLDCNYPEVFVIMGNDDHRIDEPAFAEGAEKELWKYLNCTKFKFGPYMIYGYPFVPPTPFLIKDWEKYDVSRETNPGCIPPDGGYRTVEADYDIQNSTIEDDLARLAGDVSAFKPIFLLHSPPYGSDLDRIAPGRGIDSDIRFEQFAGSKAIRRFIDEKQPYITLHGHIHESASISGQWKQQFGKTWSFSAAHNGPELAIVKFEIDNPAESERLLITP